MLALAMAVSVSAQGPSSYTSGFQVQNLDDSNAASIHIDYYNQDGTTDGSGTDASIPAGDSMTFFGATVAASDGFNGSVVISSDRPVAAIVNLLGDDGDFGGASYDSFSGGSSAANIPLVLSDFFNISTFFNVQNTGTSDVTVDVTYVGTGGTCGSPSATIAPGAAATFDQTADCTSGFIGAATVDAPGGTVAVAVVQYDADSLLAYNAFTGSGSQMAVAPLVSHNFFNSRTALQIQNTGGSSADITVNYEPSLAGSSCSETKTVAAGASGNFGDNAFFLDAGNGCNAGSGWVGSAEIDAGAGNSVVAIVNTVTSGQPNAAAYAAFDPGAATDTVNFPLVMQNNFGIFTGYGVANVGGGSTDITCTFSGSAETTGGTVAAGASFTSVQDGNNDVDLGDGYVGASTCTSNNGEPIVGVVSQLGGSGDKLLYYEGFNN
jgi:hypothetical protein